MHDNFHFLHMYATCHNPSQCILSMSTEELRVTPSAARLYRHRCWTRTVRILKRSSFGPPNFAWSQQYYEYTRRPYRVSSPSRLLSTRCLSPIVLGCPEAIVSSPKYRYCRAAATCVLPSGAGLDGSLRLLNTISQRDGVRYGIRDGIRDGIRAVSRIL